MLMEKDAEVERSRGRRNPVYGQFPRVEFYMKSKKTNKQTPLSLKTTAEGKKESAFFQIQIVNKFIRKQDLFGALWII